MMLALTAAMRAAQPVASAGNLLIGRAFAAAASEKIIVEVRCGCCFCDLITSWKVDDLLHIGMSQVYRNVDNARHTSLHAGLRIQASHPTGQLTRESAPA
jgi:hypothetical protein